MSDPQAIAVGVEVGLQLLTLLAEHRAGRRGLNQEEVLAQARAIRDEIGTAPGTAAALAVLALVAQREREDGAGSQAVAEAEPADDVDGEPI